MERRSAAFVAAVFFISLAAFCGLAVWMVRGVGYLSPEAAVRAGIATDLLHGLARGREALICSVWWSPVPTTAQLAFAWIPGAVESGLAACLLSAIGAAVLCVYVARSFLDSGFPKWSAAVAALLCAANPWIVLAAVGGSAQIWVLALLLASVYYFRRWTRTRGLNMLVCSSVCLGLLPVIEHHAILYAGVLFAAGLLYMVFVRGFGLSKIEGSVVLAASPVVYMVGLWFLFNWLIMGNFVYFLKGVYVEPVETTVSFPTLAVVPPWLGAWATLEPISNGFGEMILIAPLLPVAAGLGLVTLVARRKLLPLVVLGLLACMPLFHAYMAYRGRSFGRHEDLIVAVPLSFFLLAHCAGALRRWPAPAPRMATALAQAVLAVALIGTFALLPDQGDSMPLALAKRAPFVALKIDGAVEIEAIVEAVDEKPPDIRIAVIGFEGYRFMRQVNGDERFLHYVNWDFGLINHNTRGKPLYLLVPKPEGAAKFDDVHLRFPVLYEEGDVRLDLDEVRALLQAVDEPFATWRLIFATRYYTDGDQSRAPQARNRSAAGTGRAESPS